MLNEQLNLQRIQTLMGQAKNNFDVSFGGRNYKPKGPSLSATMKASMSATQLMNHNQGARAGAGPTEGAEAGPGGPGAEQSLEAVSIFSEAAGSTLSGIEL